MQGDLYMNRNDTLLRNAVAGLLALSAAGFAASSMAADEHAGEEQCAGVIKAGKNDCATATNACHGHVTRDADPMAWIYVPKGTCERIVGASVVKVKDPTPTKTSALPLRGRPWKS
jgi:uncharacterized membrane protein